MVFNIWYLMAAVAPKIVPFTFGDEPFTSGASATVVCAVTEGDLPLDINWAFHSEKHSTMMGITTTKAGPMANMLQIESVAAAHNGNYTCQARNAAGSRNFTASLIVYGTPIPHPSWTLRPRPAPQTPASYSMRLGIVRSTLLLLSRHFLVSCFKLGNWKGLVDDCLR